MTNTNVFILFPESEPSNQWILNNELFQTEEGFKVFIKELESINYSTNIEEFEGFYDSLNINNFLKYFEILEECYPHASIRTFRSLLKSFQNWRDTLVQIKEKEYFIFKQITADNSFCEMFERKFKNNEDNFSIFNLKALELKKSVKITSENKTFEFVILDNDTQIENWFSKNRNPQRKFHVIGKHGENGKGNWINRKGTKDASPLLCNAKHAQKLLYSAIGENIEQLFNYDTKFKRIIKFHFENTFENGENLYHGYHLAHPINHQPDKDEENKIHERIKRILDYRREG